LFPRRKITTACLSIKHRSQNIRKVRYIIITVNLFLTEDEHKVQDNFWTQVYTRTCEISHGRGNRTLKLKRQSPKPYCWAIRKNSSSELYTY